MSDTAQKQFSVTDAQGFSSAVLRRFAMYFMIVITVVLAIVVYLEYRKFHLDQDSLEKQELLRLELAAKILTQDLRHAAVDVLTIAGLGAMRDFTDTRSNSSKLRLEQFFLNLAKNQGFYQRIRVVNSSGLEVIRINYSNGVAVSVPAARLQDRSAEEYFRQTMQLEAGQLFISSLERDDNQGKDDMSHNTVLRIATPLFDSAGKRQGIIVLNYLATFLHRHYREAMVNSWGQAMLVNADGYWLYRPAAENNGKTGAELGRSFAARFPEVWKQTLRQDSGIVRSQGGFFVFYTLQPADQLQAAAHAPFVIPQNDLGIRHWKLISRVPARQAVFGLSSNLRAGIELIMAMLVLSAAFSLLLAHFRTRNVFYTRQLRGSEQRVRLLLDSVAEGIFGVDADGRCTFINPGALQLLGYENAEQLLHRRIHDLIHPARPDGSPCTGELCPIQRAFREGASVHSDDECLWRLDGSSFPVEYWATPLFENGRKIGVVTAFIDVTRRRQAEQALHREHDALEARVRERTAELEMTNLKLKQQIVERERVQQALLGERNFVNAVLTTVGALIIVLDTQGRVVRFNNACEQLSGYRFEELQGKCAWDYLLIAEEVEPVKDVFHKLTAGDFPSYFENYWVTKSGKLRLISWSNTALLKQGSDAVEYVIATGIDVTERKQAEDALRNSEEQLRLITDNLPVVITYLDADQRYRFNNRLYEQWFGMSREQVYGMPIREALGDDAYLAIRDKIEKVLGGSSVQFESIMPYKDAGQRYVSATYVPHIDQQGQVKGFFALIQDISERKRAEEQVRLHQEELAHVARVNMMGELATGLAHELNQPLTAIHTYAEIALGMATTADEPEAVGDLDQALIGIMGQAERASKIVHRLREFVSKRGANNVVTVDLNELIRNVLEFVQPALQRYKIDLRLELDPQLPATSADKIQIEQVLLNLLSNSIQAMASSAEQQDPRLTVGSRAVSGYVQVLVADNGPGMDASTQNKIFEPFVSSKGSSGMGLGLSISRSIMEAHEGNLWAESSVGQGATFYLRLPIQYN